MSRTAFHLLRSLNEAPPRARSYSGKSHVFPGKIVDRHFASVRLTDRLIRRLVRDHVIKWKEILESFEFFDQTRKQLRSATVVDVCCGHGLVGILYALLEREVERVILADSQIPPNLESTLRVAAELGPWVSDKVEVLEFGADKLSSRLPVGSSVLAAHGCGRLTDDALDLAMAVGGAVAVMPCCCHPRSLEAPAVLYGELGVKDGVDVHRTYRLHQAGYQVLWKYIPEAVTPMNRIIVGAPEADARA